jgi:hypothetical protein
MKVIKIKTDVKWDELTDGKVYNALPRPDTLAPYTDPYIWYRGMSRPSSSTRRRQ